VNTFISNLADSIARMEGYFPCTRARRNNDPGTEISVVGLHQGKGTSRRQAQRGKDVVR
jgi:hypothetical protein